MLTVLKIFVYTFLLTLIFGCESKTVDLSNTSKHDEKKATVSVNSLSQVETNNEMKGELGSEKWLVDKNGKGIKP